MTNYGERHLRALVEGALVEGALGEDAARAGAVREDWPAVAAALNARMALCRVSQAELALAARVSVATLRVLQRGNGDRRAQNSTLYAISRALGWPDDHLVRVLLGDQYPADAGARNAGPSGVASVRPGQQTRVDESADNEKPDDEGADGQNVGDGDRDERAAPRADTRQPPTFTPLDTPTQILLTLRSIERRVDAIARHVIGA